MADQTCGICGEVFDDQLTRRCPLCGTAVVAPAVEMPRAAFAVELDSPPRGPVQAARQIQPSSSIEGVVVQLLGPMPGEIRRDWWKVGTILLLLGGLFPLYVLLWISLAMVRMTLSAIGLGAGRGRGLFDEILLFHVVGGLFRRPEAMPTYDHVIETPGGFVSARQEGEFREGRLFVGNRVRLLGHVRGGALVVEEGFNDTLGVRLTLRRSRWRPVFFLLLAVAGCLAITLLPVASQMGRY